MITDKQAKILPTKALYHRKGHTSSANWFAYQVSLTEVRLIELIDNIQIKELFAISVPSEPIKSIKVLYDSANEKVYMGIAFLTKYFLYEKDSLLCSGNLYLDRNIVGFKEGFCDCSAFDDGKQIYFAFVTSGGEIHIIPTDSHVNKTVQKPSNINARVCSAYLMEGNIALGCENGSVLLVDLNTKQLIKTVCPGTSLPILNLIVVRDRVIASTCEGEIISIAKDFGSFCGVSAHQGAVWKFEKDNGSKLFSFGDDCVLNIFSVQADGSLKLIKSEGQKQKANLLLNLEGSVFMNFYEQSEMIKIE